MLKDTFNRNLKDLRISVTDRCNFRCTYCMPAEIFGESYEFLPKEEILSFEEITKLATIFVELGVEKIRITGGEPLMRSNLEQLVLLLNRVHGIQDLTLTTNGYLLEQQAEALKKSGLGRITISLDTLDDELFKTMNGRGFDTKRVLAGIQAAQRSGLSPIKINAVVQKNVNENTIVDLAKHFKGTGIIVRFIEYMDVGNLNAWRLNEVVPASDIFDKINSELPLEPLSQNYAGEVASRYKYRDGSGEIGIISSVSQPFCGACTRARLSTDGRLYTCLFGETGLNLRDPMRDGATSEQLKALITTCWEKRDDKYSEDRTVNSAGQSSNKKIEMYQIGG
ncbi:MAG: GTP 3',8-cyclase MoaA [Dehalococcoidia bacterium]|nr:GTP 3',8-cyclase MoaA [Dehalococcoidia bacterium]